MPTNEQPLRSVRKEVEKALLDDVKAEMKGIANMGMEITSDTLKKYMENQCNLATCRYNRNGICQNEDKRKECVEVSRKVLCLEGMDNVSCE